MRFSSLPFDSQPSFRSFPSDEQRWSRGWLCFGGSHPAAPWPCGTLTPRGAPTPRPGSWHRHAAGGRGAVPGEGGCHGVVKPTQTPVRLSCLLGLVSDNISTGRCERSAAGNGEPQICGERGPGSPRVRCWPQPSRVWPLGTAASRAFVAPGCVSGKLGR